MKLLLSFLVAVSLSACAIPTKPTMSTCSLDEKNFAERKALFATLMESASEKQPIKDGYVIAFETTKPLGIILRIVELEQSCCPFLSFRVDVPAGEPTRFRITGPVDAQPLIKELVAQP